MLGRTHDLAAFTVIILAAIYFPPALPLSLATILVAMLAAMIGGLVPDIDDPSSDFWDVIPIGEILGKVFKPLAGKHRNISHSLIGVVLVILISKLLLLIIKPYLLVDLDIVWIAFMLGFSSHLLIDSFTSQGILLFWPLPFKFGIPPFKFMRIKTGGIMETVIIFPSLVILNIYLVVKNYEFLSEMVVK